MNYETKSVVIGRMKRKDKEELHYPCFISMFDINNPHQTAEVPKQHVEFEHIDRIVVNGLTVNLFLAGNDMVINDLENISVEEDSESKTLTITGTQN